MYTTESKQGQYQSQESGVINFVELQEDASQQYITSLFKQTNKTIGEIRRLRRLMKGVGELQSDGCREHLQSVFEDIFYVNRLENIQANLIWLRQETEKLIGG